MIQDIITYTIILVSLLLFIRSFVRFFTVRTSLENNSHACGSCDKSCALKSVMNNIEKNAVST